MSNISRNIHDSIKRIGIEQWGIVIFSLCWIIYIYYCCANVIWLGDDVMYEYHFSAICDPMRQREPRKLERIFEIFDSLKNHFNVQNGRLTAHFFVQLFCAFLGQKLFAIINAFFYPLLFALIIRMSGRKIGNLRSWLTIGALVMIGFWFTATPSRQIGYIWMPVLIFIFLFVFFRKERGTPSLMRLVGYALLALIAGNAQETFGFGICFALGIYAIKNLRHLGAKDWVMGLSFFAGLLVIVLSPRAHADAASVHCEFLQGLYFLFRKLHIFYILLVISIFKLAMRKMTLRELWRVNPFFWEALLITLPVMLWIGIVNYRQLMGIELFSIILITGILRRGGFGNLWLLPSLAIMIWIGYLKVERVAEEKRIAADIENQIITSDDEFVIANTWKIGWFPLLDFNEILYMGFPYQDIDNEWLSFKMKIEERNHLGKSHFRPIYVIPDPIIKERFGKQVENEILPLNDGTDSRLIFISTNNPKRIQITTSNILGIKRTRIAYETHPVMITDDWQAFIILDRSPFEKIEKVNLLEPEKRNPKGSLWIGDILHRNLYP